MAELIRARDLLHNTWLTISNRARLLRRRRFDYVVLRLQGSIPERSPRPPRHFPLSLLPWPAPPASVEGLTDQLERLEADSRVQGAVLLISGLSAGVATLGSLRDALLSFRSTGKRAVAYMHELDMWSYYLACACDQIMIPESATFRAAGLWSETLFLKDALALVGLEADFEAIAEYKVSPDMLRRSEMTEPHREMLESLLDSLYAQITRAVAEGRQLGSDQVREAFDSVPLTAEDAADAGLVDSVCYEDELPECLGEPDAPATLLTWSHARRLLVRRRRWRSRHAIGVVSIEGVIVPGTSRRLPVPLPLPILGVQAGSDTIVQQLRAAARDKRLAALVLHVDSPGGSALASDLIAREVAQVARLKPVVVYMGNEAASGGYYVSAPGQAIIAQPTTLTGSIGIWGGKLVTAELFVKVHARREVVSRGQVAGLYADTAPFSEDERQRIRADIGAGYRRFKDCVAEGRGMTEEEVETLARGRVWTGEQARARGLVDELGDLARAAERARELAEIDPGRYTPLVAVQSPKRALMPSSEPTGAGGWLQGLMDLAREGVWAMAPWSIRVRG